MAAFLVGGPVAAARPRRVRDHGGVNGARVAIRPAPVQGRTSGSRAAPARDRPTTTRQTPRAYLARPNE
ncbi:hypothetical protein GCM10010972_15160 [Cellulomonas carbonis]|uniref:Uncharacterized protein n=1 Tax=Cellulomonas carbonis T26 TaxID=947969 RepID=A0A0A0BT99_9CELL|nr:hypothetical protein N868_08235 [Cellulomonas carbonis T26]GGC03102.1 hypothetical protein GCM10010972_15160 [Cellulomonas carbonis]